MKRRIISLFLVLALILTCIFSLNFVSLAATSGDCSATGSNVTWEYDSSTKTLTLEGSGAVKNYGDTLRYWAPWHDFIQNIQTINVGEGITTIGRLNFMSCTALKTVNLPQTLKVIEGGTLNYGAFRGCTALEKIVLPSSLEEISAMAFRNCTALKSITFPDSLKKLGEAAFRDCTSLVTVNFSSGLTQIPAYAFYNTRISVIEIPECIESIGILAFANCPFIREVTVYNTNCEFKGVIEEDPFYNSSQTITFYGHSGSTTKTFVDNHPNSSYKFVSIDKCDHLSTHEVITKEATCTEVGETTQVCDECGFVVSKAPIVALGHDWKLTETIDNTKQDGHIYTYYDCPRCLETKVEVQHKAYVDGYYTYKNTADCDKAGYETYECNVENCGKKEVHYVAKGNHKVDEYIIDKEPTCTTDGSRHGKCTKCNKEITEAIPALGHTDELIETLDNTQKDGHIYEKYRCSVCNEETVISTHRSWVEGYYTSTVTTQPQCMLPGTRQDECTICKEKRIETIPATGQHQWKEISRTEPTCTERGTIMYECEVCGRQYPQYIDKNGHDYQLVPEECVEPTCTVAGKNKWKCSVCSLTKTDTVAALGHRGDEETQTIITQATCTQKGKAEQTCNVCGVKFEKDIQPLGHNYVDSLVDIPDQPGHALNTPTCTRCNDKGTVVKVHTQWIDGYYETKVITQGSCAVSAVTRDQCTLCDATRNNTVPAPGHKYVFDGLNESNRFSYTCSVCKNSVTSAPTAAKALWNEKYINTNPYDNSMGYIFELTGDGIINAKDYAMLVKCSAKAE